MRLTALRVEDLPHYTYDDYAQWEGRWELINGIPYAMVPMPTIEHQDYSGQIYRYLSDLLENCPQCKVFLPVDWQITEDTIVQPDVLVVCKKNGSENFKGKKLLTLPVVVFEILSPSSERKDRVLKYQLYENAGVMYYCIVDPGNKSVEIFQLGEDKYREMGKFQESQEEKIAFQLGPCSISFDFRELFRRISE